MPSLSSLMKEFEKLTRESVVTEARLGELRRQIALVGKATRPRARKTARPHDTGHGIPDGVRDAVKLLRDAGGPLGRKEIAERLGIAGSVAGFRLAAAIKLGFVEKARHGLYVCAATVPEME